MVDDEARVGMAVDQLGALVELAPAQEIDRQIVLDGGPQDPVEAGIGRRARVLVPQEDADADRRPASSSTRR